MPDVLTVKAFRQSVGLVDEGLGQITFVAATVLMRTINGFTGRGGPSQKGGGPAPAEARRLRGGEGKRRKRKGDEPG